MKTITVGADGDMRELMRAMAGMRRERGRGMNGHTGRGLATLIIAVCLMCAGCGAETPQADRNGNEPVASNAGTDATAEDCSDMVRNGYKPEFRECRIGLRDGRRVSCVLLLGNNGDGLSCDWEHATGNETK